MPRNRKSQRSTHANFDSVAKTYDESFLSELLEDTENPFVIALDGVQDPHNLGACIRSAEAAGCHALIIPKNRATPLTDTVRHTACGAAEILPVVQVTNIARTLDLLKDQFLSIVGTGDEESAPIYSVDLTGPLALVMGAEGSGLRRLSGEKCDHLVSIPMLGETPCLNVSVATGVCLFEAVRQRLYV
ncbi:MAG: 23S rRNA (guanosine(2251)-2'-O)-methyltransferase RlmB [Verrucomicrobiota bacterium]